MEIMDNCGPASRKPRPIAGRGIVRIAAVSWTILLLTLLLAPLPSFPGQPRNLDRAVHFLLFFVETVLLFAVQAGTAARPPRRLIRALTGAAMLAVGTEVVQGFLPYRSLQPSDLGMDFLGSLSASLPLYVGYALRREQRHEPRGSQAPH